MPNTGTLQQNYVDFSLAVSEYLGWGVDPTLWQPEQVAKLLRTITTGYFRFLSPTPDPKNDISRVNWSFMKPVGQISTLAPINQSLPANVTNTATTLTDSGASFPVNGLVGANIQITSVASYTRQIISNTATQVTWNATGVGGGTVPTNVSGVFQIGQVDYPLPLDFAALDGKLWFSPDSTTWYPLRVISEQQLLEMRSVSRMTTGVPLYAAVAPLPPNGGAAPQANQVKLWPYPGAQYVLQFRYTAVPVPLSEAYPYPLGGALFSDAIRASCLAVTELENFDEFGVQNQNWINCLKAAIARDGELNSPATLGEIRDDFDPRRENRFNTRVWPHVYGSFTIGGVANV